MKIVISGKSANLDGLYKYLSSYLKTMNILVERGPIHTQQQIAIVDMETFKTKKQENMSVILALEWEELEGQDMQLIQQAVEKNFSKILGIIDLNKPFFLSLPLLKWCIEQEMGHMNSVLTQSLEGLKKLKKIHEKIVPLRQEKLKGLQLIGKYSAGLGAGGEFYDIVKNDIGMFLFMTSSNSYIASSLVLTHFDLFKRKKCHPDQLPEFIKTLETELARLGEKEHKGVNLLALQINQNDLQINGHCFGKFWCQHRQNVIFSGNNLFVSYSLMEKAHLSLGIVRNERVIFISPGLLTNLPVGPTEKFLRDFIKENIEKGSRYLLDELFFTLKREDVDHFLAFDATAIMLEVDDHVLVKM